MGQEDSNLGVVEIMYWTEAERAGLKAMGRKYREYRRWFDEFGKAITVTALDSGLVSGALNTIRSFVAVSRAVKDAHLRNCVDVSSLKPWTGRGRIEREAWVIRKCLGLEVGWITETQQDRED